MLLSFIIFLLFAAVPVLSEHITGKQWSNYFNLVIPIQDKISENKEHMIMLGRCLEAPVAERSVTVFPRKLWCRRIINDLMLDGIVEWEDKEHLIGRPLPSFDIWAKSIAHKLFNTRSVSQNKCFKVGNGFIEDRLFDKRYDINGNLDPTFEGKFDHYIRYLKRFPAKGNIVCVFDDNQPALLFFYHKLSLHRNFGKLPYSDDVEFEHEKHREMRAATKIQARYRGHLQRAELKKAMAAKSQAERSGHQRAHQLSTLDIGEAQDIGERSYQEDRMIRHYEESDKSHFVTVCDGHGGSETSEWLKENLYHRFRSTLNKLMSSQSNASNTKDILNRVYEETFKEIDTEMKTMKEKFGNSGAVCVCSYIIPSPEGGFDVFTANIGDSQAILLKSNSEVSVSSHWSGELLTVPHTCKDKNERERILRIPGGHISFDNRVYTTENDIVEGLLAVSRAFGDFVLSKYLIVEPHFSHTRLTEHSPALILTSDGVSDAMNTDEVAKFIGENFELKAEELAKSLVQKSIAEKKRKDIQRYKNKFGDVNENRIPINIDNTSAIVVKIQTKRTKNETQNKMSRM